MNTKVVKHQYSAAVDPHIYGPGTCQTQKDWIELALAALDQAGLSVEHVKRIGNMVHDFAPDKWD